MLDRLIQLIHTEAPQNRGIMAKKWIQKAIKHPGALHRALHVPEGEKIPAKKMAKASHSTSPKVRRMAGLAHTLKKLRMDGGPVRSRADRASRKQ